MKLHFDTTIFCHSVVSYDADQWWKS